MPIEATPSRPADAESAEEQATWTARDEIDPALAPTLAQLVTAAPERRAVPRSLLERYEGIELVGEGGMGTVYRAMDRRLGRVVALKLIKGDDPELWRRFIGEARAQAKLQHEHVCRVYEAGEAEGTPFIAMQYIDGEPLSSARLTLEQAVKVLKEVSAAVHEAHRLGMIHRDIKPGNILVERREDGTVKPYVMDFGLAREVEDKGQTRTGAIVGTPAYMPPEQAQGDIRAMDRRSDVYSLGATLYDVLAGRPPFVADNALKLLLMVAYEEAPALGKVKKGVPRELETIVMKCLEREPSRRYESARALSEELGRYLDGEPIEGRRASPGYVLWKKAKKHKLVTVCSTVMLTGAVMFSAAWVQKGRRASEQARLAQALGEDVKGMELFLRNAYGMPLHDVEREREVVRRRLSEIEERMKEAGAVGEGPGQYALGRGALALGDPAGAREHLEKALSAGYSSPDLEYALGQALGELFRRALEETRRITNEEERRKRVGELEASLKEPALLHLRAAVAAKIEAPQYAEGLIALYDGDNDEALRKAKEAFDKAPWMYEAKKLEGDALYAMGSKHRHDAAFDYDKMRSYFEPAARAYAEASEAARSDPEVHRAECELWEKMGQADALKSAPFHASFDRADAACARAVQSSSRDAKALVRRALVLGSRNYFAAADATEDAVRTTEEALRVAEAGVKAAPGDVMAHYAVAQALYLRATMLRRLGRDASMSDAEKAYERVIALNPRFTWAINELGYAYHEDGAYEWLHGRESKGLFRSAIAQFARALEVDPTFTLSAGRRLGTLRMLLDSELERGRPVDDSLAEMTRAVEQLEKTKPGPWLIAFWKARTFRYHAVAQLASRQDPRDKVRQAVGVIVAQAGPLPEDYWLLLELGECHLIEAEHALREGGSPLAAIEAAQKAAQKAGEVNSSRPQEQRLLSARVALTALRAAARRGALEAASFDAALDHIRPLIAEPGPDAAPHAIAAAICAVRAAWQHSKGGRPEEEIRQGLEAADSALARNPRSARVLLSRAELHLTQARAASPGADRAAAARLARESFEAAFRENPLLSRDHEHEAKEADALAR